MTWIIRIQKKKLLAEWTVNRVSDRKFSTAAYDKATRGVTDCCAVWRNILVCYYITEFSKAEFVKYTLIVTYFI